MVKAFYTSADKRLPSELARIQKSVRDVSRPTGTEKSRALLLIEEAVANLEIQQANLEAQQASLANASVVLSADTGDAVSSFNSSAWSGNRPSVQAKSLSGKFQVMISGGALGGSVFYTFSTTGLSRDRALGGSASALRARVESNGGASSAFSSAKSFIISLPPGETHTFTLEHMSPTATASYQIQGLGGQIIVQPLL